MRGEGKKQRERRRNSEGERKIMRLKAWAEERGEDSVGGRWRAGQRGELGSR